MTYKPEQNRRKAATFLAAVSGIELQHSSLCSLGLKNAGVCADVQGDLISLLECFSGGSTEPRQEGSS